MATSALTAPQRRPRLRPLVARAALGGAALVATLGLTAAGAAAAPPAGDAPTPTRAAVASTGPSTAELSRAGTAPASKSPAVVSPAQTGSTTVGRLVDQLQVAATGPVAARLHLTAARPLPAEVSVGPAPSAANDSGSTARPTATAALAHLLAARSALLTLADAALTPPGTPRTAPAPRPTVVGPSPGTAVVRGDEPDQRPGAAAATSWRAAGEAVRALPAAVQRGVEQVVQQAVQQVVRAVADVGTGATEREAGWAHQPGRGSLVGQSAAVMSLLAACALVAAATVGRREGATRS